MLDVSCGPGLILDLLARHSARSGKWERVVGLDYSEMMVTLAREACGERATVVVADACDLPFADGAFDVLHSSAGAHCWGDLNSRGVPESAFREMYRVLKPTGEILVSTVVLLKPTTVEEEYSRTPNTPFFDERAVCRMIQDAGFRDVEVIAKDKCFVAVKAVK
jgi:ATP-binding cassette subfamily F protein 2